MAFAQLFGGGGGFGGFGGFNLANQMAIQQQAASDFQQAQTIQTQIKAEAKKSETQRWQIMSELQTKIHSITAEVTINKAKSADKLMQKMTAYISG